MIPAALADIIAKAASTHGEAPTVQVVPGMTLHVDGDYAAYSCGGEDKEFYEAWLALERRIAQAKAVCGAEHVIIHLSAGDTNKGERSLIATVQPYQGNREGSRKPRHWLHLRQRMEALPNALLSSHREADDSIAEAMYANPNLSAVYTADKDMRMLPGTHVAWATYSVTYVPAGGFDIIGKDKLQFGTKWFWMQLLHGDGADHIPGLPRFVGPSGKPTKIGDLTSAVLLAEATNNDEALALVAGYYQSYYKDDWADRLAEQAALLWLRTRFDAPVADMMYNDCIFPKNPTPVKRELVHAFGRLTKRVKEQRAEINAITSQTYEGDDLTDTEW